ncbi:MAG TPA: aconitate hydratase AcnA [Clostridiales bacterium]|nr:aconitate hydratase AcnA [Clostridiales bacterium]
MISNLKEKSCKDIKIGERKYYYYSLKSLEEQGFDIKNLPFSIKILLENVLRQYDGRVIKEEHIKTLANWVKGDNKEAEVPFKPARVLLQDFTGVPAVVDLASMRKAMADAGGDVKSINPEVPVDLVIDHSVQVDYFGSSNALSENVGMEFKRNKERYQFLSWAQKAFDNFTVVPPATGIVHQVNLEYLASLVINKEENGKVYLYPDTLVGTDSHTTMINGLGVLGWGVGGIEAEAGMLGQPSYFPVPEVIGVHMTGKLQTGVTATDLALRVTELLRERGVVGKFIEYYGSGVKDLSLADRATVANMAPEYGATCGFFPADEETLAYLKLTGRTKEQIEIVREYLKANDMFYDDVDHVAKYTDTIELDLSTIEISLSGPKRPQDRITLNQMKDKFIKSVTDPVSNSGHGLTDKEFNKKIDIKLSDGRKTTLETGSLAIASITSCTNTSNPSVMLGAGILAKKAVDKGLKVPAHVKTSLAPGSKVVTGYLENSGLQLYLDKLGFQTIGYGCATCIGNSGPLLPEIAKAIDENEMLVSSVLSGNRNFEGRIHSQIKANYLASPILVVAYALAGTVNIDLNKEPLGYDQNKEPIFLKDIWPSSKEIQEEVKKYVTPDLFINEYAKVYTNNDMWNSIESGQNEIYEFDLNSTYIQNPTYFTELSSKPKDIKPLSNLRVIAKFKDSITTDHISPAGSIGVDSPAGKYLNSLGVNNEDFNTYGSRRGNHEIMMRGTFANIRIRNQIAPDTEGGYTKHWLTNETMPIYDASMDYMKDDTGLLVIAGKDYGMGSSRDWAAKGPNLLGVKVVLAESFERIHRSNLVMMGVLPLQFLEGETADSLGLTGEEIFNVEIGQYVKPYDKVKVQAKSADGKIKELTALVRFDSEVDVDYYRHGGILQMVLREKLNK